MDVQPANLQQLYDASLLQTQHQRGATTEVACECTAKGA